MSSKGFDLLVSDDARVGCGGTSAGVQVFLSAAELGKVLASGGLTSEALVSEYLDRIRTLDPRLHAFVEVYADAALADARASDGRRLRNQAIGPLDGIPFAAKDLFDVEGHVTSGGSRALPQVVATRSATAVRRLQAAGMVLVGKTHTVEFAYGAWGTNPSLGDPVNPRDPTTRRVPGGSSSGSGVAVAAGLVTVALGTDTGGSVRTPSALCGVVGLKTSLGLVGRGGVLPLALVFDTVGPMTRSVEDAALVLAALQAEDPEDPATFEVTRVDPLADLGKGVAGLRLRHPTQGELQATAPSVLDRFHATVADLAAMGAIIEERRLPRPLETYAELAADFNTAEAWHRYGNLVEMEPSLVDPTIAKRMSRGARITIRDYLNGIEQRRLMQAEFRHYIADADALLLPTSPVTAAPIDGAHEAAAPFGLFTRIANLVDLAALSVPMGDVEKLPTGLQVVVRRFGDALALRIGRALEVRRGGLFVRPPGQ